MFKAKYTNKFSRYFRNIYVVSTKENLATFTVTRPHSIFTMFIFKIMVWNNENDELLCGEVLLMEPDQYKARSREQGNVWKKIADALNLISTESTFFHVDACAVSEGLALLTNRQAEKEKSELKQSGISPEDTPLDEVI